MPTRLRLKRNRAKRVKKPYPGRPTKTLFGKTADRNVVTLMGVVIVIEFCILLLINHPLWLHP